MIHTGQSAKEIWAYMLEEHDGVSYYGTLMGMRNNGYLRTLIYHVY
jgi:hypothetical protein